MASFYPVTFSLNVKCLLFYTVKCLLFYTDQSKTLEFYQRIHKIISKRNINNNIFWPIDSFFSFFFCSFVCVYVSLDVFSLYI